MPTGKINKYFTWKEAACRDGTAVPEEYLGGVLLAADQLFEVRMFLGCPLIVNSWYRTKAYNKLVKGKPSSKHLTGIAVDFYTRDYVPAEVAFVLEGLIRIGAIMQGGIGVYEDFVHYDCRNTKARW